MPNFSDFNVLTVISTRQFNRSRKKYMYNIQFNESCKNYVPERHTFCSKTLNSAYEMPQIAVTLSQAIFRSQIAYTIYCIPSDNFHAG